MPQWASALISIAVAVIPILLGIIAKKYHNKMDFEDKQNRSSVLHYAVVTLVKATEKMWPEAGSGKQRKEYVVQNIKRFVTSLGVKYRPSYDKVVADIIEAAVKDYCPDMIKSHPLNNDELSKVDK